MVRLSIVKYGPKYPHDEFAFKNETLTKIPIRLQVNVFIIVGVMVSIVVVVVIDVVTLTVSAVSELILGDCY